jgi:hypothetical protein
MYAREVRVAWYASREIMRLMVLHQCIQAEFYWRSGWPPMELEKPGRSGKIWGILSGFTGPVFSHIYNTSNDNNTGQGNCP